MFVKTRNTTTKKWMTPSDKVIDFRCTSKRQGYEAIITRSRMRCSKSSWIFNMFFQVQKKKTLVRKFIGWRRLLLQSGLGSKHYFWWDANAIGVQHVSLLAGQTLKIIIWVTFYTFLKIVVMKGPTSWKIWTAPNGSCRTRKTIIVGRASRIATCAWISVWRRAVNIRTNRGKSLTKEEGKKWKNNLETSHVDHLFITYIYNAYNCKNRFS